MQRLHQIVLIVSVLGGSWFGMQAVHELGHVLGGWASGGKIARVVLHPGTISRTDLSDNPHPLLVVWCGPLFGSLAPVAMWLVASVSRWCAAFALRFFAGFCLIANGAYLGIGSFERVGDAGDMLRLGSPIWLLWLFGLAAVPSGLGLWHGQGGHFGLGRTPHPIRPAVAWSCLAALAGLVALGFAAGE